jgi:hypothetical protein
VSDTKSNKPARSRVRAVFWLVVSVVGLWAGFFILNITGEVKDLGGGEKALRIVFAVVWFTFWIGAMVYNVLNYQAAARARKAAGPASRDKEG